MWRMCRYRMFSQIIENGAGTKSVGEKWQIIAFVRLFTSNVCCTYTNICHFHLIQAAKTQRYKINSTFDVFPRKILSKQPSPDLLRADDESDGEEKYFYSSPRTLCKSSALHIDLSSIRFHLALTLAVGNF